MALLSDFMQYVTIEFWFYAISNNRILQWATSDFLQRATSVISNEWILQWATSDFLQRATSVISNEWILQRVTSDFLQRATSVTSNEPILQWVTSDFTMSNEQRVKIYASGDRWLLKFQKKEKKGMS